MIPEEKMYSDLLNSEDLNLNCSKCFFNKYNKKTLPCRACPKMNEQRKPEETLPGISDDERTVKQRVLRKRTTIMQDVASGRSRW